jgi:hypothetical protein
VLVGSEDLRAGRNSACLPSGSLRAEFATGLSLIGQPAAAVLSGLMLGQAVKGVSTSADANMAASSSGKTIVVSLSKVEALQRGREGARGVETFGLEAKQRLKLEEELRAPKERRASSAISVSISLTSSSSQSTLRVSNDDSFFIEVESVRFQVKLDQL